MSKSPETSDASERAPRLALLRFSGELSTKARATRLQFRSRLTQNLRDALTCAEAALSGQGIGLIRVTREYDRRSWPYATRGFFALSKRIPRLLREFGLPEGD